MWQGGIMHGFKGGPELFKDASPSKSRPQSEERVERPVVFELDFAIRCSNLGQGTFPMVALFQRLRPSQTFRFVANTEGRSDSSPVFRRLLSLAYNAGDHPQADVMLNVYHAHGKEVGQSDYIGSVQLRLSELVSVDRQEVTMALRNAQPDQQAVLRSLGSTLTLAVSSQRQGLRSRPSPANSGMSSVSRVPAFSPEFAHLATPSGRQRTKGNLGASGSNTATYGAFLTPVPPRRDANMSGPPSTKGRSPGLTPQQASARKQVFLKQARLLVAGRVFTKFSSSRHLVGSAVHQRLLYYRRDKDNTRFGTLYWVDASKSAHTSSTPPSGISSASLDALHTMQLGKKDFTPSKQAKQVPSDCCVSLLFEDSTLHLQADSSKIRDAWVCGIRACLEKRSSQVQCLDAPEHLARMWKEMDNLKAMMTPSTTPIASREPSSER
jgi:hypothetical protein